MKKIANPSCKTYQSSLSLLLLLLSLWKTGSKSRLSLVISFDPRCIACLWPRPLQSLPSYSSDDDAHKNRENWNGSSLQGQHKRLEDFFRLCSKLNFFVYKWSKSGHSSLYIGSKIYIFTLPASTWSWPRVSEVALGPWWWFFPVPLTS